jgi:hypothetical protein
MGQMVNCVTSWKMGQMVHCVTSWKMGTNVAQRQTWLFLGKLINLLLRQAKHKQTGNATIGKMTLVDLAGSERQSKTQAQVDPV